MDKAFLVAFSITLLAGLSTVFGSFIVLFSKSKKTSWLSFSMSRKELDQPFIGIASTRMYC